MSAASSPRGSTGSRLAGRLLRSLLFLASLPAAAHAQPVGPDPLAGFGVYPGDPPALFQEFTLSTALVPMRDGVRLAVDVLLPAGGAEEDRYPALLRVTRTWRGIHEAVPGPEERFFARHGYAFVKVDARGSGASFGRRGAPWSPEERADGAELLRWIQAQPWSNGRIGAVGQGYDGGAAELLAALAPEFCKAAYSRFAVFDAYQEWLFPGGVKALGPLAAWTEAMAALDRNSWPFVSDGSPLEVRPLDEDVAASLLAAALADHRANLPLLPQLARVECRDDRLEPSGLSVDQFSPQSAWPARNAARTPLKVRAGWHDAATAAGVLARLADSRGELRAVIGPETRLRPGLPGQAGFRPDLLVEFEREGEWADALYFFDRHLRGLGEPNAPDQILFYFTLGEERWKWTQAWPPQGVEVRSLFPAANGLLATQAEPEGATAALDGAVRASRGPSNRWRTGEFAFGLRSGIQIQETGPRLVWLGEPLPHALEITGTPVAHLRAASSAPNAALFLYLDALAPGGALLYLTEGALQPAHRSSGPPPPPGSAPSRSFLKADRVPLKPGEPELHGFALQPLSARVPAGHRLRLSLAASDADAFSPPPARGAPVLTLFLGGEPPTRLDLPCVPPPAEAQSRPAVR